MVAPRDRNHFIYITIQIKAKREWKGITNQIKAKRDTKENNKKILQVGKMLRDAGDTITRRKQRKS